MKRIISYILAFALCVSAFSGALTVFAAETPIITVSNAEGAPGETVVVSAVMEENPGINAFTLEIQYDSTKLELLSVEIAPELGGSYAFSKKLVWGTSSDSKYNGEFVYMTFNIKDGASGEAAVSLSARPGDICNYDEEDVNFAFISGKVKISGSGVLLGDVTGDGKVNPKDVLALRKYLGGVINDFDKRALLAADTTGDGKVNPKDVLALRKYLGGVIQELG